MVHHAEEASEKDHLTLKLNSLCMKCFMILCEKLMTAEKASTGEREGAIEIINIDTDGRDFPLFCLLLCSFCHRTSHQTVCSPLHRCFRLHTEERTGKNIHFDLINICEALSMKFFPCLVHLSQCRSFFLPSELYLNIQCVTI